MNDLEVLARLASRGGSLVEIYCRDVPASAWTEFFCLLSTTEWPTTVWDNEGARKVGLNLPKNFSFDGTYSVSIQVGKQTWTSTLWTVESIDIQGDPKDIRDLAGLREVRQLMQLLYEATGRQVALLPETLDYETTEPYFVVDNC